MTNDVKSNKDIFIKVSNIDIESSHVDILTNHKDNNYCEYSFHTLFKLNVTNMQDTISIENVSIEYHFKGDSSDYGDCSFEKTKYHTIRIMMLPYTDKDIHQGLRIKKEISVRDADAIDFYGSLREQLLMLSPDLKKEFKKYVRPTFSSILGSN